MRKNGPNLDIKTIKALLKYRSRLSTLPFTKELSQLVDCLSIVIEAGQGVTNG